MHHDAWPDGDQKIGFALEFDDQGIGIGRKVQSRHRIIVQDVVRKSEGFAFGRPSGNLPLSKNLRAEQIMKGRARRCFVCHYKVAGDAEGSLIDHCRGRPPKQRFPRIAKVVIANRQLRPIAIQEFGLSANRLQLRGANTGSKQVCQQP